LSIRIYYDNTSYRYRGWKILKTLLARIIAKEQKITGDLNVIITNDEDLRAINVQFLEHDYYTDVITFNYNSGNIINGEIYISLDRVKENSVNYKVRLKSELTRVIIHGVLHLLGHDDKSEEEKLVMRKLEDYWLDNREG
jgi:rRNA maturation RNase YbeY